MFGVITDPAPPVRAGETALLRSPASVMRPVSGDVWWFGRPEREAPALRRWVGMAAHESRLYPHLALRENLLFVGRMDGIPERAERPDQPLAEADLAAHSERLPERISRGTGRRLAVARDLAVAASLAAAVLAACFLAPTELSMGHAQRILYVHVPVAWLGLLAFLVMAGSGVAYLARRDLTWDHWFQAAGELGWICSGLTLLTGSLWARAAWGSWWEWDPRLTTAFILWAFYSGILLVRSGLEDPHRRARVGAVLAVLGGLDVPLVVMATRWFRGLHPVAPEMTPLMRLALLISVVGFTVFFVWLAGWRRAQLDLESRTAELQRQTEC